MIHKINVVKNETIEIQSDFCDKDLLKSLPGHHWDRIKKIWILPLSRTTIDDISAICRDKNGLAYAIKLLEAKQLKKGPEATNRS